MQAIASQLWGDASMWYLIADANGLTGQEPLPEGMSLTVPNKVTNIHNNSSTFQVYNAGEAIGDTMPTLPDAPPPPADKGGGGCGGIAKILVIVIAIVATVLTAGAAAVAMGLVQGATLATATVGGMMSAGLGALGGSLGLAGAAAAAIGGAVGSILSQGAAMAMGVQDKFSWSGVAMSAVGAGVGAGLGNPAGASTLATVGRAAASNAITQGVAVATGLQKKFDWRGVAASALGAGVGHGVGKALKDTNWLVKGTAEGMANGGVQAAVTGQQPNWGAITAGSFASTMGNGIAESVADGTFGNALGQTNWGGGPQYSELEQEQDFARENNRFAAMAGAQASRPVLVADSGQFMTDVGGPYGDVTFGEPVKPNSASDAMFNALLQQVMQNPAPASGPRITLDDFRNPVYIGITRDELARIMPKAGSQVDVYLEPLNSAMERHGISTPSQQAAFLAQVGVESGQLRSTNENLNYSAPRLTEVWPTRFPNEEAAAPYANNPEALGNFVYANRLGNGNEASGDGYRYRGGGLMQTTGRANYRAAGFEDNPEALRVPTNAANSAGRFWIDNGLNDRTAVTLNRTQFDAISTVVNGGRHGAAARWQIYQRALQTLGR